MDFYNRNSLDNSTNNGCAWVEVDMDAISENLSTVRALVGPSTKVCAVIKADAYGHGVLETARILEDQKVDYLAVAVLDEAIELRQMGITLPILILGPLMPNQASYVLRYDLTQTICSLESAMELSSEARKLHRKARIHIKVDTGMGRLGIASEEAVELIKIIRELPSIELEGIFTHFATADSIDKTYLYRQWETFNGILEDLKKVGIRIPIAHCATSATIIDLPFMKLDMVRPGLMLYGLYPRADMRKKVELRPALTLKAKISFLKDIKKETSISYGRKFTARPGQKIATVPIGYNDGYRRFFTNQGEMLAGGVRCQVAGTVCMDHVMLDVTDVPDVQVFDEVTIIGRQNNQEITADDLAKRLDTINYEVVSCLGRRLPRIYFRQGRIAGVRNLAGYHSESMSFAPVGTPISQAKFKARDTQEITINPDALGLTGARQ